MVFFDGCCGLCNRSVDWILKRDKVHRFSFAPLQGETAAGLFRGMSQDEMYRSLWLMDEKGLHRGSTAFLRICRGLTGAVRLLALGIVVPRPIRDGAYRLIARNRYALWGRSAECRISTAEERPYFLT